MRRLLFGLLVCALVVIAVGFYLNWFSFSVSTAPDGERSNATLTVDRDRIKKDTEKARQKVEDATSPAKQKVSSGTSDGDQ